MALLFHSQFLIFYSPDQTIIPHVLIYLNILLECNICLFAFHVFISEHLSHFFNIILNSNPFLINFTIPLFDITERFINAFTILLSQLLTNASEQARGRPLAEPPWFLHPFEHAPNLEVEVKY